MKINIDKNLVELTPENLSEKTKLEILWKTLIDCNGEAKKLAPVGEYVPQKNEKGASFYIEGLDEAKPADPVEVHVDANCKCYCSICNKLVDLKPGDPVPVCCGRIMEVID